MTSISLIQRTRKNLMAISTFSLLEKVVSFVLVIAIARYLGVEVYGKYAFAVALASFFVLFSDLGITNYLTRDLAKRLDDSNAFLTNALSIKLITSVFAFVVLVMLTILVPQMTDEVSIVLLVGAGLIIRGLTTTFFAVIRAHQKMQYEAYAGVLNRVLSALFGLTILITTKNIVYVLWVILFAGVVELFYAVFIVNKHFSKFSIKFDFVSHKRMIFYSLPFLITAGMTLINYRVDSVILNFIHGDKATGIYNASYAMILSLIIIQEILGRILLPLLTQMESTQHPAFVKSYQQPLKFLVLFALFIALLGTVFSTEIIAIVFGNEFSAASQCLKILVWALLFMFASYILNVTLISVNGEKQVSKARVLTALLNLTLNLVLIPRYSYIGASIATVLSEVSFFASSYYYLVRQNRFPLFAPAEWFKLMIPFLGGLTFALIFNEMYIFFAVPAVLLIYVAFLVVGRTFSKDEIQMFVKFIRS